MIGRLFSLFLMWAAYASAYPGVQYYSKAAGIYMSWVWLPILVTIIIVILSILFYAAERFSRPARRSGPVVYSTRELLDEGRTSEERRLRRYLEDLYDRQNRDLT